ncbi:MAG: lipid-A-disaccharide synthase [Myxococcota bacterium]
MLKLILSAVEPSGDRLAAELLAALRSRGPVDARGVAGPAMRAAGVAPVALMEDVAAMGITEVLRNASRIRAASTRLSQTLTAPADLLVVIDGPDFHLPIAARARKRGVIAVGYVSPQVWAWRPRRVHKIARTLDALLCLFSFEPALYPDDFDVRFVGHPVRDRVLPRTGPVDPDLFGLLPASRRQEMRRILPDFLTAAERIRAELPTARFLMPLRDELAAQLPPLPPYVKRVGAGVESLRTARAALTKSGTVTLELAVMGVPQVVAHRVQPLTYHLGRWLVNGVEHISLPNILARKAVVPEFLQNFSSQDIADAVLALPRTQPVSLDALGEGGAAERAADALMEIIRR